MQSFRKGSLLSYSSLQSNFVSDDIIGSLPQGLSGKEREKVFQSVPLSPTLNLLNSMPQVGSLFCTIPDFRYHKPKYADNANNDKIWLAS